jgi:uncharacterized protein (TIGR02996 family)
MSHEAFLQAVRDDPDDDLPRLVYADWLEDQGEADRAELIRLQIALSRGGQERAARLEMLRRLRDLIVRHRHAWLGPLVEWDPEVLFERGLVGQVNLRADTFLKEADASLARHPAYHVRLVRLSDGLLDALAALPRLSSVVVLDLCHNHLGDHGVARLLASPHLTGLRHLILSGNEVQDEGAAALARSCLPRLTRLDLSNNRVGDEGARALACSGQLGALSSLVLWGNDVGDEGAAALAGAPRRAGLRHLDLGSNRLGDDGLERLASSPHLAGLERLELSGNRIGAAGYAALAAPGRLPRLGALVLGYREVEEASRAALAARFGDVLQWRW